MMLFLTLMMACSWFSPAEDTDTDTDTETGVVEEPMADTLEARAAAIAKAIDADPSEADAVLEAAGMTEEEYEQALFDIAADPKMSRAFLNAR